MSEEKLSDYQLFVKYYNQLYDYDKAIIWEILHSITLDFDKDDIPRNEVIHKFADHWHYVENKNPHAKQKHTFKKLTIKELRKKIDMILNPNQTENYNVTEPDDEAYYNMLNRAYRNDVFYATLEALHITEPTFDSFSSNYKDDLKWIFEHTPKEQQRLIILFTVFLRQREDGTDLALTLKVYDKFFVRTEQYIHPEE